MDERKRLNRFAHKSLLILLIFFGVSFGFAQGFLHVENGQIVSGENEPVLLKGIGLGGWLVPEGYMLHIPGYGSPSSIRTMIVDLIGETATENFYENYYQNYVTKADIDSLASWGFNSIRLPFHYNQFSPAPGEVNSFGYEIVDSLLSWCEPHNMMIILDMHCAPGGQNSGNISDSDGTARLWLEDENKAHTIEIWQSIAETYADNPLIGGYDLLNEPVLPDGIPATDLRALYMDITSAIRSVDQNHILFIEGNWYGTDFTGLTPPFDTNMVYAFHKYWSPVTQASIQSYVNMSNAYNIPLWLGESGENSNPWFGSTVSLMESNGIGWCWWAHKKVETTTSPLSANIPLIYQEILDYWNGSGSQPNAVLAEAGLLQMAENLSVENCVIHPDVIQSLFDSEFFSESKPFKPQSIPGTIQAVNYDMGNQGIAYLDSEYMNTTFPNSTPWNSGWEYRNDGVDIQSSDDSTGSLFNVGWTDDGEWMNYTMEVLETGLYQVTYRTASTSGNGEIQIWANGQSLSEIVSVPNTDDWQNWMWLNGGTINLQEGEITLQIRIITGGFNLKDIRFENETAGLEELSIPDRISIWNYPNPFNGKTQFSFSTSIQEPTQIIVFDITGKNIRNITIPSMKAHASWDGRDNSGNLVGSGVYFYRYHRDKIVSHGKMLMIK